MRIALLSFVLLTAFLGLTGCGTSANPPATPTPSPTAAPTPVAMSPGIRGVRAFMAQFDEAVLLRAMTLTRSYLTPSLAARTPSMALPTLLGVQRSIPTSASYTVVSVSSRYAEVDVTYHLAKGTAHDRLILAYNGTLWRVSAIKSF